MERSRNQIPANDGCDDHLSSNISGIRVNDNLKTMEAISLLKSVWQSNTSFSSSSVSMISNPFKIFAIKDLLKPHKVTENILKEMLLIDWKRKHIDLYEFYQSKDLGDICTPYLESIRRLLETEIMPYIGEICGENFSHLSASCSMYSCGDHLLIHDDLFMNRKLAFIFYISPWQNLKNWKPDMGGALETFEIDQAGFAEYQPVMKIPPRNNQLVFFPVGNTSLHQVEEVTSYDYPRLAISGWFYNIDMSPDTSNILTLQTQHYSKQTNESIKLSEVVNNAYTSRKSKQQLRSYFEETSQMRLEDFLLPHVFERLRQSLIHTEAGWFTSGPINIQNYEKLLLSKADETVQDVVRLLKSSVMFDFLKDVTSLNLARCHVEVQRWNRGCYTILCDDNSDSSLDIFFYMHDNKGIGVINLVSENSEQNDVERQRCAIKDISLSILPKANTLNIAYRSGASRKLVQYVSKLNAMPPTQCGYMIVASYIE